MNDRIDKHEHDPDIVPGIVPEANLPDRLIDDLAKRNNAKLFVSPEVDQQVLDMAEVKLAQLRAGKSKRESKRFVLWPWPVGGAAAAIVMLLLLHRSYDLADLDRNGKVDIVDAFTLAKQIQNDEPMPAHFDINGDGVIDERDVEMLAYRAVKLNGEAG